VPTRWIPSASASARRGRGPGQLRRGRTLAKLLRDLGRRCPGIRFRVIDEQDATRPRIKFFVDRELARSPAAPLAPGAEVLVVAALSGG